MDKKRYYRALEAEKVNELLNKYFKFSPKTENINIIDADNRVLLEDIISPIDVPHFNRSMRDGFAVKAEDTFGAEEDKPITLKIIGNLYAGDEPKIKIVSGECIQIATGAPIPDGSNAIVMVEYTNKLNDNSIEIYKSVFPGQYIIKKGNDIKKGEIILKKGKIINPRDIGALAAIGKQFVKVYSKPKITLFSTGNEIISLDKPLTTGKVYDINSYTLYLSLKRTGASVSFKGILPDEIKVSKKILKNAISESDLVILSGGTSKGIGDVFPSIIPELGDVKLLIHGIRVKPGKPTLFASLEVNEKKKFITLLPGFPTSALTIFNIFLKERIMKWCKIPSIQKKLINARLTERVYSELGRREFKSVKLIDKDGIKYAVPTKTGSDAITTLTGMDGYFEIPEQVQFLEENEEVQIILFD
ncbi:MAG: molybdopterin-binding protein [Candidatus Helarchaeota archaeon]